MDEDSLPPEGQLTTLIFLEQQQLKASPLQPLWMVELTLYLLSPPLAMTDTVFSTVCLSLTHPSELWPDFTH